MSKKEKERDNQFKKFMETLMFLTVMMMMILLYRGSLYVFLFRIYFCYKKKITNIQHHTNNNRTLYHKRTRLIWVKSHLSSAHTKGKLSSRTYLSKMIIRIFLKAEEAEMRSKVHYFNKWRSLFIDAIFLFWSKRIDFFAWLIFFFFYFRTTIFSFKFLLNSSVFLI